MGSNCVGRRVIEEKPPGKDISGLRRVKDDPGTNSACRLRKISETSPKPSLKLPGTSRGERRLKW